MSVYINNFHNEPIVPQDKIKITASMSENKDMFCDCCHGMTEVIMIKYPRSGYRGRSILKFSTVEEQRWLCSNCLDKLKEAIKDL